VPSLEIIAPVFMGCVLLWWVSRGMSWSQRLTVAVITLVVILALLLIERAGYWPDQFRR
jgi:hypothetical protein